MAWGFEMTVLLAAGVSVCVMGLLAIGFGIPISDTSFGNALLIAGVVILCTGVILIGMWLLGRELVSIASRVVSQGPQPARPAVSPRPAAPANPFAFPVADREPPAGGNEAADRAAPASPPPWADEVATRSKPRPSAPEIAPVELADPPPPPPPDRSARRNLLFSAKRRDKAEAGQSGAGSQLQTTALEAEPKVSFENAWPNPSRPNGPTDRVEPSLAPTEASRGDADAGRSAAPQGEGPVQAETVKPKTDLPEGVTVVRSGTVDEMAYTYYSDGSIEAQLPGEGPIRFASLDALRTYVEQRK